MTMPISFRHPGLVPGSTHPFAMSSVVAQWTPAQGRGDGSEMEAPTE